MASKPLVSYIVKSGPSFGQPAGPYVLNQPDLSNVQNQQFRITSGVYGTPSYSPGGPVLSGGGGWDAGAAGGRSQSGWLASQIPGELRGHVEGAVYDKQGNGWTLGSPQANAILNAYYKAHQAPATAQDFVQAGNIISAASAGNIETAQALQQAATPQAKQIVQNALNQKNLVSKLPQSALQRLQQPDLIRQKMQGGFETYVQPVGKTALNVLGGAGEAGGKTFYGGLLAVSAANPYKLFTVSPETGEIKFGVQKAQGLPYSATTERQFGAGGRTMAQVAPAFLPGGWGVAGAGLLAAGSESVEEAVLSAGTGIGFGAFFRTAPTAAKYGLTFLPKVPASVSKAGGFVGKVAGKATTPVLGGWFAASSVPGLMESFGQGEEAYKKASAGFASSLGAFTLGSRAAEKIAGGLLSPLEGQGGLIARKTFIKEHPKEGLIFGERYAVAESAGLLDIKPGKTDLLSTERASPKTGKIVESFLKKNKGLILGGSTSQVAQLPKELKGKITPSDIDLYAWNEKKTATSIFGEMKKQGIDARMDKEPGLTTFRIYETKAGESQKSVEVHNIKQLWQNVGEVRPFFQPSFKSIVKNKQGVSMLGLATQAKRKVIGGTFDPLREKDILQFESVLRPAITGGYYPEKKALFSGAAMSLKGLPTMNKTGFVSLGSLQGLGEQGDFLTVPKAKTDFVSVSSMPLKKSLSLVGSAVKIKAVPKSVLFVPSSATKTRGSSGVLFAPSGRKIAGYGLSAVSSAVKTQKAYAPLFDVGNYAPLFTPQKPSYNIPKKGLFAPPYVPQNKTPYTPFVPLTKTPYAPPAKRTTYKSPVPTKRTPLFAPPYKPTKQPPYAPPYGFRAKPPTTGTTMLLPPTRARQEPLSQGFFVLTRKKGVKTKTGWRSGAWQIASPLLSKGQAFAMGQKLTDPTAKRSFRLIAGKGRIASISGLTPFQPERYYKSKSGSMVERSRWAISTQGEKGELAAGRKAKALFGFKKARSWF